MLVFRLLTTADGQSNTVDGAEGTLHSLSTCFPGSSSSALGLQSLGLSGQAPSSSSLDAGTLSDTTASGNCPQQGAWLRVPRPCRPVQCCESVTGSCSDRPSWTSCLCCSWYRRCASTSSYSACCLALADPRGEVQGASCWLMIHRPALQHSARVLTY